MRNRPIRRFAAALFLSSALFAQTPDPQALEVTEAMHEAMGGLKNWNNTRYVQFKFQVGQPGDWRTSRAHLWDKWEGRYRFESTDDVGVKSVILFNTNTKVGKAYMGGEELPAAEAQNRINGAYSAYINDTYWLAMPWKWLDGGVTLKHLGEETRDGITCDIVELSFKSVGLTPGDVYRAFVSRESHLMVHWEYTLQSEREGAWDWEYADTNGLKLAATHTQESGREIEMGGPVASDEVDETLFTDPTKSL